MNSLSPASTMARARSGICFDHFGGAAREKPGPFSRSIELRRQDRLVVVVVGEQLVARRRRA